eukprot:360578-Chlamydomonas_euryale.AAC.24
MPHQHSCRRQPATGQLPLSGTHGMRTQRMPRAKARARMARAHSAWHAPKGGHRYGEQHGMRCREELVTHHASDQYAHPDSAEE